MAKLIFLLGCFILFARSSFASNSWYDELIPKDYNPMIFPNRNEEPLAMNVSMYIISLHDFDPITLQVTADMYMRQHWKDYRLTSEQTKATDTLQVPDGEKRVWVPDMFFVNAVQVNRPGGPNRLLRVSPDGSVIFSQKLQVRFACQTSFADFPFDRPTCPLFLESYSMTANIMAINWMSKPGYSQDVLDETSPELSFLDIQDSVSTISLGNNQYARLELLLNFARTPGYYVQVLFIPTGIFAFIASLVFFIDSKELGARIRLSSLMMACILIAAIMVKSQLPHIRYNTALDAWTVTCFTFTLFPLLISILVHRLGNVTEEKPAGIAIYLTQFADSADRFMRYLYLIGFTLFVGIYSAVHLG